MSEIHMEEHSSPIQNWKQLVVVAVLALVVPVLLIVAIVQIITGGLKVDPRDPAMSEEAVAARIQPVGQVNLVLGTDAASGSSGPADTAGSATKAIAAVAPSGSQTQGAQPGAKARAGDQVYQQTCAMCHATGLAGAPKTGDNAAWQSRVAQGKAKLYEHAIKGIRAMPAKGGNPNLPDVEVKAAVDYMVTEAK